MLQIIPLVLKYHKAILIGLAATAAILIGLKINQWRNDSQKLDKVLEDIAHTNAQNKKLEAIGIDLDDGLNNYREKVRHYDKEVPAGPVFDRAGVQRIRKRLEADSVTSSDAGM